MIRTTLLTTLLGLAVAMPAQADCGAGSKTVFSCLSTKGKQIELCDAGKTIDYSFGKPGEKPEMALRVPRAQASTSQWEGIGRYMSYSVDVPNGKTTYSVFWSVDRQSAGGTVEAGVNVMTNDKLVATVNCAAGKRIVQEIEGIDLKRQ